MVLVDTCVWIDHFRDRGSREARLLDTLLEEGLVAISGPIFAELVSGARNRPERRRLEGVLSVLPFLDEPQGIWEAVADSRYRLARRGYQASLVDLLLAHTAVHHEAPFLTSDRDFQPVAELLRLELFSAA